MHTYQFEKYFIRFPIWRTDQIQLKEREKNVKLHSHPNGCFRFFNSFQSVLIYCRSFEALLALLSESN